MSMAYRMSSLPEQLFDEEQLRQLRGGTSAPSAAPPLLDQPDQGPEAVADNNALLEILYALGVVAMPPLGIYAGRKLRQKEQRRREQREDKSLRKEREFRGQQEGLLPTPPTAVPGYMSVGEARGITAEASAEKAQAALDKATAQAQLKLEAEVVPIFRNLARKDPVAALKLYGELKQSANPFAALLQTTIGPRIEQLLKQSGVDLSGRGAAAPTHAPARPAMPETPEQAIKMGWKYKEANGKKGYVSPNGKLVLPVK